MGGAFLVEAMVWGFPFSFAIFQEVSTLIKVDVQALPTDPCGRQYYLAENGPFTGQQGLITLTGTLSSVRR